MKSFGQLLYLTGIHSESYGDGDSKDSFMYKNPWYGRRLLPLQFGNLVSGNNDFTKVQSGD